MTVTVSLTPGRAIDLDPIIHMAGRPAVLLSLIGEVHGRVHNVALIPLHKIDAVIEALQLVATQVRA